MKTFLACLIFAAIGGAIGWNINQERFGKYEPHFGPIDFEGKVTAANADRVTGERLGTGISEGRASLMGTPMISV